MKSGSSFGPGLGSGNRFAFISNTFGGIFDSFSCCDVMSFSISPTSILIPGKSTTVPGFDVASFSMFCRNTFAFIASFNCKSILFSVGSCVPIARPETDTNASRMTLAVPGPAKELMSFCARAASSRSFLAARTARPYVSHALVLSGPNAPTLRR